MLMHPELQGGPQPVPSGGWNWRVNIHSTLAAQFQDVVIQENCLMQLLAIQKEKSLDEIVWL